MLGPSTTVLMRFLAAAMARQFSPGDEIILTVFDHESNIGPWLALEERGVVFKFWRIDRETFAVDLDELDRLMTPRTKLVCVTHASNILGAIMPIADIARLVHARGAKLCVDGVAYAPHRAVDVAALDVDYYVFSFYKTYGPHFAVLYGRYENLLELDGLYHYFYGKEKVPEKLEPGNTNYELAWGCTGIVDYLDDLGGGTGDRAAIERAFDGHRRPRGSDRRAPPRLPAGAQRRADRSARARPTARMRVPTIAFKAEGRDSARDRARRRRGPDRHPLRRLPLPPARRASRARSRATASCASRWSTTTRSTRSTASSRASTGRWREGAGRGRPGLTMGDGMAVPAAAARPALSPAGRRVRAGCLSAHRRFDAVENKGDSEIEAGVEIPGRRQFQALRHSVAAAGDSVGPNLLRSSRPAIGPRSLI